MRLVMKRSARVVLFLILLICLTAGGAGAQSGETAHIDVTEGKTLTVPRDVNGRNGPLYVIEPAFTVYAGSTVVIKSVELMDGELWYDVDYYDPAGWSDWAWIRADFGDAPGNETPASPAARTVILDETVNGARVTASLSKSFRALTVQCDGASSWQWSTSVPEYTGALALQALMGGTRGNPFVVVYSSSEGLTALSLADGCVLWTVPRYLCPLGPGITYAVGGDGTLYIGGGETRDPVAINVNGTITWRASSGHDDIFWLYGIEPRGSEIWARYGHVLDQYQPGWVIYDLNGRMLRYVIEGEDNSFIPTPAAPAEDPVRPSVTAAPAKQASIYGLALMKIATRTGPGTNYADAGTYFVGGQYLKVLSRAYDSANGIWWVKCEIPDQGRILTLWTGYKRFDSTTLPLESIPIEGASGPDVDPDQLVPLRKGDVGEAVVRLQRRLQTLGYYGDGVIDGDYGAKTERAVRAFQQAYGLNPTGEADVQTQAALYGAQSSAGYAGK